MLNAGNELIAEQSGCTALATVVEVCGPYLGSVLAVAGSGRLRGVRALAAAIEDAARLIRAGQADKIAHHCARAVLGLDTTLASRYVDRLKNPAHGLVDGNDFTGLETVVKLRRRYLPGNDAMDNALDPAAGLVTAAT